MSSEWRLHEYNNELDETFFLWDVRRSFGAAAIFCFADLGVPSRLSSLRPVGRLLGRAEQFVFCRRPSLEPLIRVWKSSAAIIYQ